MNCGIIETTSAGRRFFVNSFNYDAIEVRRGTRQ